MQRDLQSETGSQVAPTVPDNVGVEDLTNTLMSMVANVRPEASILLLRAALERAERLGPDTGTDGDQDTTMEGTQDPGVPKRARTEAGAADPR